jgi:hypothetical protein
MRARQGRGKAGSAQGATYKPDRQPDRQTEAGRQRRLGGVMEAKRDRAGLSREQPGRVMSSQAEPGEAG